MWNQDKRFFKGLTRNRFGKGNGTPLQYSCLENPMGRGAWWAAVHGVAKSLTRLSDFTFTFHFHALEKEMATHSSVLAWRIPGMAEPGGLPSMGSHTVGHDWSDLAAAGIDWETSWEARWRDARWTWSHVAPRSRGYTTANQIQQQRGPWVCFYPLCHS